MECAFCQLDIASIKMAENLLSKAAQIGGQE